jgi:hypothetical protein
MKSGNVAWFLYQLRFLFVSWAGGELSPILLRPLNGLLYQSWIMMDDDHECGVVGGMLDKGNRCTWRKPPVPLSLPQILSDLTWVRTLATAVGCRRPLELRHGQDQLRLIAAVARRPDMEPSRSGIIYRSAKEPDHYGCNICGGVMNVL